MKFILLIFSFLLSINSFAQFKDSYNVEWKMTVNDISCTYDKTGCNYESDTISIIVRPQTSTNFWNITIFNWTDKVSTVKWDEAKMQHAKMLFGDNLVINRYHSVPDDVIYKSDFISKSIGFEGTDISKISLRRKLRTTKQPVIIEREIIIPIEIDGQKKVYRIKALGQYSGKDK